MLASTLTCLCRTKCDPVKVFLVSSLGVHASSLLTVFFLDDELYVFMLPVRIEILNSCEGDNLALVVFFLVVTDELSPFSCRLDASLVTEK